LTATKQLIRVGHSPDPDDAFMFHALTNGKIDTGDFIFTHELVDIETLNQRAFSGELELTAVSIHAYGHLSDKYSLCSCGASMGDNYGPTVVTKGDLTGNALTRDALKGASIAVPGELTSAFLALRLLTVCEFTYTVVPFDQIIDAVEAGNWNGAPIDAGLVIHEGQLTYDQRGLRLVVDLGQWWHETTGNPLPLGANAIRRDLGDDVIAEVTRLLGESIRYALANREEAIDYALQFGRDLDREKADKFIGMYVNEWTVDFGDRGRAAVAELLRRGHECGLLPKLVEPEFV
jgi:1,4-dihydroxy-6-naphthoate synthase